MPEPVPEPVPAGLTLANWDLGGEPSAWAYRHARELFPATEIPPQRPPAALDRAELSSVARFPVQPGLGLADYVDSGPVSGMVVVLGGRIVFERYPRMQPGDRHLLMSVTKSFTSAVVGILEGRGLLDLGQPVDTVLPELGDSCWAGITGHDVLDMTSGIDCLENDSPGRSPIRPIRSTASRPAWAGGRPHRR